MPRRPRPTHRTPPKTTILSQTEGKATKPQSYIQEKHKNLDGESLAHLEGMSSGDSEDDTSGDEGEDADAPRVVRWEAAEDETPLPSTSITDAQNEDQLRTSLASLPLGSLRRAKKLLHQRAESSDSDDSDAQSSTHGDEKAEKVVWSTNPRMDISKRTNKHGPTEVTSKRPISRKRIVVDVPKVVVRDPRFLATSGDFDASKFQQSYGFLSDSHKNELKNLRDTLKQARKSLSSTPRDARSERIAEIQRLEQAIKRAESSVNQDRQQRVESEAMRRVKKEEQEKRGAGKGEWFLKKAEKRKVLVKARYEALSKEGGQRAVKKAIEKKRKKESQKEKRSRPFEKGEGDRPNKRRRVL